MNHRKDKKGFTLAELLVVVAIIGVLVAISIPIFSNQIRKARFATNLPNARSAKAAVFTSYLDGNQPENLWVYDIKTGTVIKPAYGNAHDFTTWWGYTDSEGTHGSLYLDVPSDPSTWDSKTGIDDAGHDIRALYDRVYSRIGMRQVDGVTHYYFYEWPPKKD
jgi:prepilin-type N-terminal cleavage/methylation domain-containing protein